MGRLRSSVLLLAGLCTGAVFSTGLASGEEPRVPASPSSALRRIGPRRGPERAKALAALGGTAATEKAVEAGLDWLARHQGEDGLWDADGFDARCDASGARCTGHGKGQHGEAIACPFDEAISAYAVLAFLGAGHAPGAPGDMHADRVERALRRLTRVGETWALPLAVEALAEAEALEGAGRWKEALVPLVSRLVQTRQPDGAWGYAAPWRAGSDVPFTGLVVPALLAAGEVGVALPSNLSEGVDRWLDTLEESRGRLAYLLEGRRYGYTPTTHNAHVALALRELLRVGTNGARHRAHAELVSGEKPVWKLSFKTLDVPGQGKVSVQVGNLSMVAWSFGTLGMFQRGGTAWSGWFSALKVALLGSQATQGCTRGSWEPLGTYERQTGGRVLATALGVAMLESPYRHRRLSAP